MKINCKNHIRFLFIILFFAPAVWNGFCDTRQSPPQQEFDPAKISPKAIDISLFYHGSEVTIDFLSPVGCCIAVKLEGQTKSIDLKKKGRIGVFWMNVGEIQLENAPQIYKIYTSEPLEELSSKFELGYEALKKSIHIRNVSLDNEQVLQEYFKFKEKNDSYKIANGILRPIDFEQGREHYSIRIPIPSVAPVGDYNLRIYYFRNGELLHQQNETIRIQKVGLTKFISNLAMKHGAVYGLFAILFAIVAGFSIGILFNSLRRK